MIPCYSLFLEVEVPDPSLNYFIVGQDQLDNTTNLLAPPPFGTPINQSVEPQAIVQANIVEVETFEFSWFGDAWFEELYVDGIQHSEFEAGGLNQTDFYIKKLLFGGSEFDEEGNFYLAVANQTYEQPVTLLVEWNGGSDFEEIQMPNNVQAYGGLLMKFSYPLASNLKIVVYTDEYPGVEFQFANPATTGRPDPECLVLWDDPNFYAYFEKLPNNSFIDYRFNADLNRHEAYANLHWRNRRPFEGILTGSTSLTNGTGIFGANFDAYSTETPNTWVEMAEILWIIDEENDTDSYSVSVQWSDALSEEKFAYFTLPALNNPSTIPSQPEQPDAVRSCVAFVPSNCAPSGNNTFTLGVSCLDGTIDLLEGWGSSKPDYIWVDVITDTTDITIDRGFDMKQGIVGTPIAGILEANVLDPFLDGLETSKVAVGQRVRLRAGNEVVFSGVANSVRSEYDAVNTPVLKIEAVDALGLLNAQMVPVRPEEGYNTRMSEAASKVDVPIIQEDSTTILNPTEDPMSALDLLVETQDSEGSVVWLDRYGTLYSTNRYWLSLVEDLPVLKNSRFNHAPEYTFTNNPGNENEEIGIGGVTQDVCLSQYKQVADTSQVINGITFYNYIEVDDVDFEGLPIKTIVRDTHTFESANSRRLYGDASVRLTTYLPETDLVGYADYIFANYDTPRTKVETIQFPMDKWDSIDVPGMVSLDIGDPVKVRIDDPLSNHTLNRATQRIAQIRHRITPVEWLCELDLL